MYITSFLLHAACGVRYQCNQQDHPQPLICHVGWISLVTSVHHVPIHEKGAKLAMIGKTCVCYSIIYAQCVFIHIHVSKSMLQAKATIAHQRLKWTPTQQESNEAFKNMFFSLRSPTKNLDTHCGHQPTPNQPHWAAAPHALWHHINRIRVDGVGATVIPGPRMQWYNKSGQRRPVICAKFTSNVENHWV